MSQCEALTLAQNLHRFIIAKLRSKSHSATWGRMKLRHLILSAVITTTCLSSGCFYFGKNQDQDINQKMSTKWAFPESLTVTAQPVGHNLLDFRTNIKITATPYYSSPVSIIRRNVQPITHWSGMEFRMNPDDLMRDNNGLLALENKAQMSCSVSEPSGQVGGGK